MNDQIKKPTPKAKSLQPAQPLSYQQITQILDTEIKPEDYVDVQKGFTPEILKPEILKDKTKDKST